MFLRLDCPGLMYMFVENFRGDHMLGMLSYGLYMPLFTSILSPHTHPHAIHGNSISQKRMSYSVIHGLALRVSSH